MIYHWYTSSQLETMANDLNRRYNRARLVTPKTVDVYDIIDMLGARIDFKYLSPDRTYLGATLFNTGMLYVWPGNPYKAGMLPTEQMFRGGTIIIDQNLNESKSEQDHFIENFTVMHECFHFDKHQAEFGNNGYYSVSFSSYSGNRGNMNSVLNRIERQANYAAAVFLMPRQAVINAAREMLDYSEGSPIKTLCSETENTIKEMGRLFGVNYSPMKFRLQEIGILSPASNVSTSRKSINCKKVVSTC